MSGVCALGSVPAEMTAVSVPFDSSHATGRNKRLFYSTLKSVNRLMVKQLALGEVRVFDTHTRVQYFPWPFFALAITAGFYPCCLKTLRCLFLHLSAQFVCNYCLASIPICP